MTRRGALAAVVAVALLASPSSAPAQEAANDTLRVAVGQLGLWAVDGPRLGQRAGIFKKHGLALDIFGTSGGGETLQAVISGSADLTVGIGTAAVLRAYSKGAPIRIIGANFTGAGDLYWYVRTDSPIRRLADAGDKTTIGYSASGSSSHNVVLAFGRELGIKAVPTATGTQPATLTQVMSGQIDIGWAAPPFGLQQLDEGKIRIIASGNDAAVFKGQTVRLLVTNVQTLQTRKPAIERFMKAYRETIDWLYSDDPAALKTYADFVGIPVAVAKRTRDGFFPKASVDPDRIIGLDTIVQDAVALKFTSAPLTKEQLAELIRIPPR